MKFEGTSVAMVTPFTKNDEIDEEGFRFNINRLIDGGVEGLLAAGTTGESATITLNEQMRLIELLVDEANNKAYTIAGAGSNSSRESLELVKHAEDVGADSALVITPYYNKPQAHGLIEHYKLINDSTNIPIILYNVPSRTGTDMDVETMVEIAKFDNIVGVKEANPDLDKISRIKKALAIEGIENDFTILSGNDDLTLPIMSLGGKGVVSVAANISPKGVSDMVRYALKGDYESALKIHYELYNLMKILFCESNPVPSKFVLNAMGIPAGHVRLPLTDLKDKSKIAIKDVLNDLSLI
ncbi:4-hydroxy-tetrahydrodipicolinate synthase [Methanobrevibacter filiformis]|uniref:4-hydroxy-tetrahydrodipicolinate synthase n=1 Tax=Methanobrevibacter filiformis TaxID=55758 RepID=A0A166F9I2_9EURY|nr:4-hydroxy-tetrahydrodipicolinate synthase [Methanobrevibacter filiformis]KZX17439.1 4-hydroxy-tetrahydrodipicolinate synthase [Methanobrevibacter filiformis]